jgi:hypothetical protein
VLDGKGFNHVQCPKNDRLLGHSTVSGTGTDRGATNHKIWLSGEIDPIKRLDEGRSNNWQTGRATLEDD